MIPRILSCLILFFLCASAANAELRFTVFTTELDEDTAALSIPFSFQTEAFSVSDVPLSVWVSVRNPDNQEIAQQSTSQLITTQSYAGGSLTLRIDQPQLWSPEHPFLYDATIAVLNGDERIAGQSKAFGIRAVGDTNARRIYNGNTLQIKGVVYRYQPDYWKEDIGLMKAAHINAVRIEDEYPPETFLSACDTAGLFVVCPPPEEMRLKPRVPVHPSIIAWDLTKRDMTESQLALLSNTDPYRLILVNDQRLYSSLKIPIETHDTLPPPDWLKRRTHPLLLLAYPPIDGMRMEGLEEMARILYADEDFLGGFLHRFAHDEGVQNGIVTTKRVLMPNYTQVQNVYSPIRIEDEEAQVQPGENEIELTVHNRYQKTNLNDTKCQWLLFQDQKPFQQGSIYLNVPPQRSFEMEVKCTVPSEVTRHHYCLRLNFLGNDGRLLSHQVVRLLPNDWEETLVLRLDDLRADDEWTVETTVEESVFRHEDFVFRAQSPEAGWFLMTQDGHVRLITGGPSVLLNERTEDENPQVGLLESFWISDREVDRENKNIVMKSSLKSIKNDDSTLLDMTTLFSPYGFVDVRYRIQPDVDQSIGTVGLAFRLPPTLNRFAYVGKGPYPSYPGMRALNDFGIFSFIDWKKFVPGNREKVTLAAFTGEHGYGLGLMMLDGSLSVLPSEKGVLASINAALAGLGNKEYSTQYPIDLGEMPRGGFGAAFRLIPLSKTSYPELFETTFEF